MNLMCLHRWSFGTVSFCGSGHVWVHSKGLEPQPPLIHLTLSYFVPSSAPPPCQSPAVVPIPSLLPSAFLPEQPWLLPKGLHLRALVRGIEFQVFEQCYSRGGHAQELLSKTKCHIPRKRCPCWSCCCSIRSTPSPSQDQGVTMSWGSA